MKTNPTNALRRIPVVLLLAGGLLLNSGCWLFVIGAAAGGAAAAVAYSDGALSTTYDSGLDQVAAATRQAIDQLQFAKPEERSDAISASFTTHNAKGDRISIVLSHLSDKSTKLVIRVGTFGDEALSLSINDKIKANL
jgi:hypothetical protein